MRLQALGYMVLIFAPAAFGQTRADLVARYGSPLSEIFLLPEKVKLTATYDDAGTVCAYRIETSEHSERVSPNLTDVRFWMDSALVSRLIAELIPEDTRRGSVGSDTIELRVGEQMRVESDDTVEIQRIQRPRALLAAPDVRIAERLVKIKFKRPQCKY